MKQFFYKLGILIAMKRTSHIVPIVLFVIYCALFTILAFNPIDRPTWWVENATVWIIVGVIAVLYWRGVQFSNTAYVFMAILVYLHTIGGHYTFANVPFDLVTNFFGFERNHYDRVAHFTVGFYAFPIAEWILAKRVTTSRFVLLTYPICVLMSIAASYELIEWIYAISTNPEAGAAYLGSQGDIWDAQKDMLADTLGAFFATIFFFIQREKDINRLRK